MGYPVNICNDLSTSLDAYYKECLEQDNCKSDSIQFKDWTDLSTIFNGEEKVSDTIFIFSHLDKLDSSIEEKLENTNKNSKFYKALKKLESTYLDLKRVQKNRDTIKDLLTKVFQNISNYKEQQEFISKLHENILFEASEINQLFLEMEVINKKDIYGVTENTDIANDIDKIKCFG